MSRRELIDPEARVPLDQLLEALPGGFNAIPDIVQRRATVEAMLAAMEVPDNPNVAKEDRTVPGPEGEPDITVRIYRPVNATGTLPGIYFIHGGGMVLGNVAGEDVAATLLCDQVGAVVVSVEYRLAPENPHPAPVEDCYAGLVWTAEHADELGIDATRLAIGGGSAGGGLAAGTALLARDRGGPALCYQMLVYPMLDDRNTTPSSYEITDVGIWDRATNLKGWQALLGDQAGTEGVSPYAAPARATDLARLPAAYLDVGTADLFRDEDIDYAQRLMQAGVPVELHVYPGAYHAFEFALKARLTQTAHALRMAALKQALTG
jgi:acetyl esterase/lipase